LVVILAKMDEMAVSTYGIEKTLYQQEESIFLQTQAAFRIGNVGAGVAAVFHLKSMYGLLWTRKHREKNEALSDSFTSTLDQIEEDILKFGNASGNKKKTSSEILFKASFRKLVKRIDDAYFKDFQQIKIECEAK
jgi:hypothetical protein